MTATTWNQTQARIVREASQLAPMKVLITVILFPFFLIGAVLGLAWVVGTLVWQAVWVGVSAVQTSFKPKSG